VQEGPENVAVPESVPDDETSGLVCFMNSERPCGPDCMAYMSRPSDSPLDPQQRHCVVLVGVERLSRHTVIGVKVISDLVSFLKTNDQDRKRTEQRPPTPPR
jgi:hypothetical protein